MRIVHTSGYVFLDLAPCQLLGLELLRPLLAINDEIIPKHKGCSGGDHSEPDPENNPGRHDTLAAAATLATRVRKPVEECHGE